MLFLFSRLERFQLCFDDLLLINEADITKLFNTLNDTCNQRGIKIIPTPLTHCNSIRTTPYRYRINLPSSY
jgi:hypothetical protein